jgi:histidinol phosphatase-like enzyme
LPSLVEPPTTLRPALFLDRDGVLNYNPPDYVKTWPEFHFLPGVLPALHLLAQTPWPLVVISNQSPLGRGLVSAERLEAIQDGMRCLHC